MGPLPPPAVSHLQTTQLHSSALACQSNLDVFNQKFIYKLSVYCFLYGKVTGIMSASVQSLRRYLLLSVSLGSVLQALPFSLGWQPPPSLASPTGIQFPLQCFISRALLAAPIHPNQLRNKFSRTGRKETLSLRYYRHRPTTVLGRADFSCILFPKHPAKLQHSIFKEYS